MRILNVSFKVISDSILESFALDFKNLAALGAKVSLALFLQFLSSEETLKKKKIQKDNFKNFFTNSWKKAVILNVLPSIHDTFGQMTAFFQPLLKNF